jgi:hypothetical protein
MDSDDLNVATRYKLTNEVRGTAQLTHAKYTSAKQASEEWKNAQVDRRVLFATLAVVCTRRLVSFAHATEPWATSVLFDFIAFCIVIFWLLIVPV